MIKADEDSARVIFPPPFIYLGMLIAGIGIGTALDLHLGLPATVRYVGGAVIFVAGLSLGLAATSRFGSAGTNVEPWKSATAIVTSGPFRWTRNPMYLAMALIYAALALLFDSLLAVLLLPPLLAIIQTQVIAREERYLEAKFGETYTRYKAEVRRWI